MAGDTAVRAYIQAHRTRFLADLTEWLAIPSISSDPEHAPDVRRSAEWIARYLNGAGFPVVETWETPGHPAVFAEWPSADPGAPTVLVYGHHDVQPVDPVEEWHTAPFEATVLGERLHARGASDDKGHVAFHALAVRAHLSATGRATPSVNLKLIIEGEEESGSPNFAELVAARTKRLGCDVVVNCDASMWSKDIPTTCTGMRGVVSCQITFHGPAADIHSGSFGGAVRNPLTELSRVLGRLHDEEGHVRIPGFYDDVEPLSDLERALFARLPFDEADWLSSARSPTTHGEARYSTLERLWARPTAEVNGIWGGYTGPGMKTIIPARAHAKVSFRIVAGQRPDRIRSTIRAWLDDAVPDGIKADLEFHGPGTLPSLTPLDHPALRAVTRSMAAAFDQDVLITREGGSGPSATLHEVLGAPVVFLAVTLPDDNYHGPNEKVEIPLLLKGAEATAYLWTDLAGERHSDR